MLICNLNKILRIVNMQKRNSKSALYNYLLTYGVSQHVYKIQQAFLLNNKIQRIKIPPINQEMYFKVYQKFKAHGKIMKDKMKGYFDNRYHKKNRQIQIKNFVLVKQPKISKLLLPFKTLYLFC